MTKIRKAILAIISSASVPLSAGTIHEQLACTKEFSCDLASVYRTLKYLELEHYASSFIMHCDAHGTERYYYASSLTHTHWFHCRGCHRFFDIGKVVSHDNRCIVDASTDSIQTQYGFIVEQHSLVFTGLCNGCKNV